MPNEWSFRNSEQYLLCNTKPKSEILQKCEKLPFVYWRQIPQDSNTKYSKKSREVSLFSVEQEKLKKNWDLEVKIQNYFKSNIDIKKAILETRDLKNRQKEKQYNEKKIQKKEDKLAFEDELKQLLKNPE